MKACHIIPALLLTATLLSGAAAPRDTWTEVQKSVHSIANQARDLGLEEDNPIIVEAQRIWQEEAEKPVMTRLGQYYITGYDTCERCCGKSDGITASGAAATVGRTVAAAGFPFGTQIYIEGLGTYTVEDRGPSGNVIDVLCNNHTECYAITGTYEVYVVEG